MAATSAAGHPSDQESIQQPHYRPYPKRGSPELTEVQEMVGSADPKTLTARERNIFDAQHKRTYNNLQSVLGQDRNVKYLLQTIAKNGCTVRPAQFFHVLHCKTPSHGFFYLSPSTGRPGIALCQNNLRTKGELQSTLFHELIHAYDFCSIKMDLDSCAHAACTEIRASALSNDCKLTKEWARGNFGFGEHHQKCVRRRAERSIQHNSACDGKDTWAIVDRIFERCYRDTAPFDGHYPW